jgi:hypothetical protein
VNLKNVRGRERSEKWMLKMRLEGVDTCDEVGVSTDVVALKALKAK